MIHRVQTVINNYLTKMPLHLQMMVKPFLNQFHQFNDEVEEEKILNFIEEIEYNIEYIKGNIIDAD